MILDPQAQSIIDAMAGRAMPDPSILGVAAYRAMLASMPPLGGTGEALHSVSNGHLPTRAGSVAYRLYRPLAAGVGSLPLIVFFHGGGFVACGLDSHDNICRRLAAHSGALLLSVDYRLAPEHRFPAAVDDAEDALKWACVQAASLGADPSRVAVAGDSAGGALAAAVARQCRAMGISLCHHLLIYPVMDAACDSLSQQQFEQGPMLGAGTMRWFWQQYLGEADGRDERASPGRARDLRDLPPATVITAGFDPLRDEGQAYARALASAGVPVLARCWGGQFHGFVSLLQPLDAAREALDLGAQRLREAFAG